MRLLLLTYGFFVIIQLHAQDSRDFYGSNTYFEVQTITDSIYNQNKNRDLIIDTKDTVISLSINDSVIKFNNKLDKTDKNIFTQGTYSIRLKTHGYHFECLDKSNYLYSIDNMKLMDLRGSTISVKGEYNIYLMKKKKNQLISSENVVFKINKDDLLGVLFGIKYVYNPKDDIKKAKRKDIAKTVFYSALISGGLGYAVYYWFYIRPQ